MSFMTKSPSVLLAMADAETRSPAQRLDARINGETIREKESCTRKIGYNIFFEDFLADKPKAVEAATKANLFAPRSHDGKLFAVMASLTLDFVVAKYVRETYGMEFSWRGGFRAQNFWLSHQRCSLNLFSLSLDLSYSGDGVRWMPDETKYSFTYGAPFSYAVTANSFSSAGADMLAKMLEVA